ncbi:HI1506-related protein [Accumulibacter sp.]|uniref:HI1506-related protein n=1 Tax=Accumulibacter sp. TaxID=2053492 RepID=UPI002612868F|nr:HI1506-related protein [Accumulibacter sp.]
MSRTPAPEPPAAGADQAKVIVVRALAEGFRRAGRSWTRAPTRLAADALSSDQIEALRAEPMLDVRIVEE